MYICTCTHEYVRAQTTGKLLHHVGWPKMRRQGAGQNDLTKLPPHHEARHIPSTCKFPIVHRESEFIELHTCKHQLSVSQMEKM